jgi:hypothetical protein
VLVLCLFRLNYLDLTFFVSVNGPFLSGVCSASSPPVCVHHVGLLLMALRCVRVVRCGGGSKDSLTSVVQILPLAFCTKLK